MRLSLFTKIFIVLLLSSLITLIGISLLINVSFRGGLQNYLNNSEIEKAESIASFLINFYSDRDGWQEVEQNSIVWRAAIDSIGEKLPPEHANLLSTEELINAETSPFFARLSFYDANGNNLAGYAVEDIPQRNDLLQPSIPVIKDDQQVGTIYILQKKSITGPLAEGFFNEQMKSFYIIFFISAIFTFGLALVLVRYFLKPLNDLQKGSQELMEGNLEYKIYPQGNDELADLSHAFNKMTAALKNQKETRDQWLSDISHELRTPISVLRSEIEAIEDGIRKPEPRYISSLHRQVLNLADLVEDLYQLSLTDSGVEIKPTDTVSLTKIVESVAEQFSIRFGQKNIRIVRQYMANLDLRLKADSKSLTQLVTNLFENSLRYTDENGVLQVTLINQPEHLILVMDDSTPTVPNESIPKLFDRLYRVDKSRSRANGGSGLGMSICQNIVNAHNGNITAAQSNLGGLRVEIRLPKENS
ncbi:ATP-binding protein [Reinekea marinisedimentorum]|uniref:histidine kinase n=1 Tax=Reinekea marinisedimentorum TaxID=230495 RepID=A0A4R3I066_9GAMM|nr:ATP-binding protein [Reinekea marinisedimentorum]TCS38908.1 two-component system sensor histidine kinase BaeS [Reinekea marinisedimentorum]